MLALTVVMIAGFVMLIATLVVQLNRPAPTLPNSLTLPDSLTLPAGTSAVAFAQGVDWLAVVTDDDRILIFDRAGGLRQTVTIDSAAP